MRRICVICTHSFTLETLYKGLFPFLQKHDYDVHVVVGDREYSSFEVAHFGHFSISIIPMRRLPSPRDLISLVQLVRFFRRNRFDVIHLSTPKASLLGAIAARLTGAGGIVFVNRRRVYELMSGWKRRIYANVDRMTCSLSHAVIPVSQEMGRQLIEEKICNRRRIRFIGNGSSNGIDTERFVLDDDARAAGAALRKELKIPADAQTLLYLGRVCHEKGVEHLVPVFRRVKQSFPNAHLLLAGPDDPRDPIDPNAARAIAGDLQIHRIGFVQDPRPLFAAADVFVFPSLFEGVPNVLLESAAMEVPAVGFDVPGVREALEHDVSGLLVPRADESGMAEALTELLGDHGRRSRLGQQGRDRVIQLFSREKVWHGLLAIFDEVIASVSRPLAGPPLGSTATRSLDGGVEIR
jgi:glycosyltransferase involved in cell wall biosynthesis